jgi:hypothetical protein
LLASLDNEYCLVINAIFFSNLSQMVVVPGRVRQEGVADISCGFPIMFAHYGFEVPEFFLVIPVIDTISVKKKDVSGTHERDLSDIG